MMSQRWNLGRAATFLILSLELAEAHYDEKHPTHFCRCRKRVACRL